MESMFAGIAMGAAVLLSLAGQAWGQVETPDPNGVPEGSLTPAAQDEVLAAQGDLNGDGVVGPNDLARLLELIGQVQENPLIFPTQGDLDSDGLLTEWDVQILLNNFGNPADRDSQAVIDQLLNAGVLVAQPFRTPPTHIEAISQDYDPHNPTVTPPGVRPNHVRSISSTDPTHVTGTSAIGTHGMNTSSLDWPPNHSWAVSSTSWPPINQHAIASSRNWPPGHEIVGSSARPPRWRTMPGDHDTAISNTRPPSHNSVLSGTWLPNHEYSLSRTYGPNHGQSTSATWPPGHVLSFSMPSTVPNQNPQPAGPAGPAAGGGGPVVIDTFPVGGDSGGI